MPFVPVPGTAQVDMVYSYFGERLETVLHFTKATPWTEAELEDLTDTVETAWVANMQPRVNSSMCLILIVARSLETDTAPAFERTVTGTCGLGASSGLPGNVAFVVTKKTAKRGRSYTGRIYHAGLSEADVTGNTVGVASADSILQGWVQYRTAVETASSSQMTVVSYQENNVPRLVGVATPVTALVLRDNSVDSQRRRLPGRGT
jgi:hypothetical protein